MSIFKIKVCFWPRTWSFKVLILSSTYHLNCLWGKPQKHGWILTDQIWSPRCQICLKAHGGKRDNASTKLAFLNKMWRIAASRLDSPGSAQSLLAATTQRFCVLGWSYCLVVVWKTVLSRVMWIYLTFISSLLMVCYLHWAVEKALHYCTSTRDLRPASLLHFGVPHN